MIEKKLGSNKKDVSVMHIHGGKPAAKKIINYKYPYFHEAATYIQDEYWKEILEALALTGRTPRGFQYTNGCLMNKKKKKAIKLSVEDPQTLCHDFIEFCKMHGNMFSLEDVENIENTDLYVSEIPLENWKTISKSHTSLVIHITHYIRKRYPNLSKSMYDKLYTTIITQINLKTIDEHNVIIEDNEIVDIVGLDIEGDQIILSLPAAPKIKPSHSKNLKPLFYRYEAGWEKLINKIRKGGETNEEEE